MSGFCPFCSADVPDESRFCPSCDEYLGWEEAPPIPEPVNPALAGPEAADHAQTPAPSRKERIGESGPSGKPALACPHTTLLVVSGESVESPLVVATTGKLVDDIRLRLTGAAAEFGVVEPDVVHLYPDSTADVVIRFAVPRGPAVPAGVQSWTLTATSVTHDGATAVIDGTVEVVPFASGSCSLHPVGTSGRGTRAEYAVLLDNAGNVAWGATVHPEPGAGLRFDGADAELTVAPGTQAEVPIVGRSKRHWFGAPRSGTFEVQVGPTSDPAPERTTLIGSREQLPLLPLWVIPLLLVLVGLGFAAIALFGGSAVAVPAVAGHPREQAVSELRDEGFKVTEVNVSDAEAPVGHAIRTDPPSGTEVESGFPVTLYVSAGPPAKEVQVPPVANLPVAEARADLKSVKLSARKQEQASDTVPSGFVIRSEPAAGVKVERGYKVLLYVSTGPEPPQPTPPDPVPVPDLAGMTQQEAESRLTDAGLQLDQIRYEPSDEVVEDRVIRSEPAGGTRIDPATSVVLYLSSGPETAFVPDVVGMSQDAAENELAAQGFGVGQVQTQPSEVVPSGSVLSTTPAADAEVLAGGAVDLIVSSGPTEPSAFVSRSSYDGNCRERPTGTVCAVFEDGFIWLVTDTIQGWRDEEHDGQPVQVAVGVLAEYQHMLGTDLTREVAITPGF